MSLVRANNVYELLSRNKTNETTPPRTPVPDASEAVSYHDVPYEQAFQQAQQQLSGPLGVLNFQHYKVNDLTRRNVALTEEVQSLNDKLEKKTSVHAEQLDMWEAFHCQQVVQWAGERVTLDCARDAAEARHAKELAELEAKHEGHRLWTKDILARRKRRIDELIAAAVRERNGRGQDTKIFRRMATLRGIEFGDLEKKTRMLLKEKFQLQADLRFERKQADEIRSKLASAEEAAESWRSKHDAEQKAHAATRVTILGTTTAHVELTAQYENEKKERQLYQKLCEDERAQYVLEKTQWLKILKNSQDSNAQLKAGLVAATALAASETKAREEAASRRAEDNKLLSAEVVNLRSALKQSTLRVGELEQSQADHKHTQTKLTEATKQAAAEARNRKVADKQRETAQRKVEQLRDQLAETTQEHQSAIEEVERLKAKFSKLADVMSG